MNRDNVTIHPSAIVHPEAILGEGTVIGPYSTVDAQVRLGARCQVQSHVVLRGPMIVGDDASFYPFSVIGAAPQHLGFKGEPSTVEIGNRVTIRESCTVNRGTAIGINKTVIGDDTFVMAYVHIAHDCVIGKRVILANSIQLAGHVEVGDFTTIGGQSAIAQFCRVGERCYIGGGSILRKDLPPYLLGKGGEFEVQGINQVGLARQGFSPEVIRELKEVFKILFLQKLTTVQALEKIATEHGSSDTVKNFLGFIQKSKMGFHR